MKNEESIKGKSHILLIGAVGIVIAALLLLLLREWGKPVREKQPTNRASAVATATTATSKVELKSPEEHPETAISVVRREIKPVDEEKFHWAVTVAPIPDGEHYYRFDVDGRYVLDEQNPEWRDLGLGRRKYNIFSFPPRELHDQPEINLARKEVTFNYFGEAKKYVRLEASFADWSLSEVYLEPVSQRARLRQQEIDRATTQTIVAGIVKAQTGEAVPKAKVVFLPTDLYFYTGVPPRGTTADDAGHFLVKSLRPASYRISISTQGYYLKPDPSINVKEGDRVTNLVLIAEKGGSVAGRVVNESNEPLAGAEIVLVPHYEPFAVHPTWGKRYVMRVVSEQDGRFREVGVRDGVYDLSVSHSSYTPYFEDRIAIRKEQAIQEKTIVLHAGRGLRGRVIDTSQKPVNNASIIVSWTSSAAYSGPRSFADLKRAKTDDDGKFAVEGLPPTVVNVQVDAEKYLPWRSNNIDLTSNAQPAPLDIVLSSGASLIGIVKNSAGHAVEGAEVIVVGQEYRPAYYTSPHHSVKVNSNAQGQFEIPGVEKRLRYELYAEHESAGVGAVQGVVPGEPAEIILSRGGTISGVVLSSVDKKPVAGAQIKVSRSRSGWQAATMGATTDDAGRYAVPRLAAGDYYIECIRDERPVGNRTLRLEKDEEKDDVDFFIETQTAAIEARVVDSATAEPVKYPVAQGYDKTGRGLLFEAAGDENGTIRIDNILTGAYGVNVRAQGYVDNHFWLDVNARVKRGTDAPELVWKLVPAMVIYGKVQGPEGEAVAGAHVQVQAAEPAIVRQYGMSLMAQSDSAGMFAIGGLATDMGKIRIRAVHPDYAPTLSEPFEARSNDEANPYVVVLKPGALLSGEVVDEDGKPVAGVQVNCKTAISDSSGSERFIAGDESEPVGYTDAAGKFVFRNLPEGQATISLTKEGYKQQSLTLEIKLPAAGETKIVLEKMDKKEETGRIAGACMNDAGTGLGGVMVQLNGVNLNKSTYSDDRGGFIFTNLSDGKYKITAYRNKYLPEFSRISHTVEIGGIAVGTENREIVFHSGCGVRGRVVDTRGQPIVRFKLTGSIRIESDKETSTMDFETAAIENHNGAFYARELSPGVLDLKVTAPGIGSTQVKGLTLKEGKTVDLGDVAIVAGRSIFGNVVRASDREPIENAFVSLRPLRAEETAGIPATLVAWAPGVDRTTQREGSDTTASDGFFLIDAVPEGTYDVVISHQRHPSKTVPNVAVGAEKDVDMGEIELPVGATITGVVLDPDGKPLSRVLVRIGPRSGNTGLDGRFTLEGTDTGEQTIIATAQINGEQRELKQSVTLEEGEAKNVTLTFQAK
jgi:protocatechuate 3,4-dioxygenase beta subunit